MSAHPFTVLTFEQRSPAWKAARLGRLTASRAADMLASVKGGEALGRSRLRVQLARERLTGRPHERGFESAVMRTAAEREPAARAWYAAQTGLRVRQTGFLAHDTLQAGVSLDGHVGDFEGLLEIKCPIVMTHFDYLNGGPMPGSHRKQIVHQLWITGAAWCDWVSFNPEFPPALRARIVRVERNELEIAAYAQKATAFLQEVDAAVGRGYARVA